VRTLISRHFGNVPPWHLGNRPPILLRCQRQHPRACHRLASAAKRYRGTWGFGWW